MRRFDEMTGRLGPRSRPQPDIFCARCGVKRPWQQLERETDEASPFAGQKVCTDDCLDGARPKPGDGPRPEDPRSAYER
jgi:hypothetical protein